MTYLDIAVPGPWWNSLTYVQPAPPPRPLPAAGSRVRVPVRNAPRVGFVVGVRDESELPDLKCKDIIEVIDGEPAFGEGLWNLALWIGHNFMCGAGEALKVISPPQLLSGAELGGAGRAYKNGGDNREFSESECYLPYDSERERFYVKRLAESGDGAALVLFPERAGAKRFYDSLPAGLKDSALLWGAKGSEVFWRNWRRVRAGEVQFVIGGPSAVFAPLQSPALVIVEDEANPAYVSARYPYLPARSAAGQLALMSKSELILGGRLPSAKTYLRKRVKCALPPDKELLRFVDIRDVFSASVRGVERALPISQTLVSETKKCLNGNMTALWIFDRKGYAADVICENCGQGVSCPSCGAAMTAESDASRGGLALRCGKCGARARLPESCPACRGSFFIGRRPGLEALESIAGSIDEKGANKKLVVGTRKILSLCDKKNVGLVAWIDLDWEAHKANYASRFQAFSMVWESIWRGFFADGGPDSSPKIHAKRNRQVIIQSRSPAQGWQIGLKSGWEYFWDRELAERAELEFPPCKPLVEIEVSIKETDSLMRLLHENGYMAMNYSEPSDGKNHIWLSASPLSAIEKVLAPRFSISKSSYGYPRVRVFVE